MDKIVNDQPAPFIGRSPVFNVDGTLGRDGVKIAPNRFLISLHFNVESGLFELSGSQPGRPTATLTGLRIHDLFRRMEENLTWAAKDQVLRERGELSLPITAEPEPLTPPEGEPESHVEERLLLAEARHQRRTCSPMPGASQEVLEVLVKYAANVGTSCQYHGYPAQKRAIRALGAACLRACEAMEASHPGEEDEPDAEDDDGAGF